VHFQIVPPYSPSPNTSQLAARMKVRRTLRSLGEGGWKGFGEFRKDTSKLCSEELHFAFFVEAIMSHKRVFVSFFSLSLGVCLFFTGAVFTPSRVWSYEPTKVADGGAIEGKVVFRGTTPGPRKVIPTQDQQVCGGPRDEPRIVLGPDNAVQGAIVFLKGVEKGKAFEKSKKPPVVDNNKCKFEPEIQVVQVGTEIVILNSDPVLHNTHGYLLSDSRRGRTVFNQALPQKGQQVKSTLKLPGVVDVACDVHGWMQGWILVAENPYYDITQKSGSFTIKDIPPGKYTMATFQPYTGVRETAVTVEAKKTSNVNVELKK
jgi:plastocyanin